MTARRSWMGAARSRLPLRASLAVLMLAGLLLIGQGLWIPAKALLAQVLLDRAFDQALASGRVVKPWRWADTWPVARIEVPRLGVRQVVLEGGSGQALAFAPGRLASTARPGERGVSVFAAHRDTHFRFLGAMKPGDEVLVTRIDGARFRFRVTGSAVTRWDQFSIDSNPSRPQLVLTTCWPFDALGHGPLRYVLYADETSVLARKAASPGLPSRPASYKDRA